ncbi:MAG: aminoacyl-histidine dipeptidase [Bacteriovoracaceae bacterium]|nr:aminoacyl-histidine dipeptidase [Bacteroidota bacterium]
MSEAIKDLQPTLLWKYFAEISKIPRGSKNEKAIAAYVMNVAKQFGLVAKQDKFMNVVVKVPATNGRENVPSVCLQGHLDMVPEKNKDKVHDFTKDPIELVRQGNMLMANGTTLGADNGVAVATNLAIMEDRTIEHGPLELLFTVDEETGLTGANNLKPGFLESKTLMNLDSEEEGSLFVGCSGGRNTIASWKLVPEKAPKGFVAVKIVVKGLKGGHSGLEIDKGRGNSIKIINRVLIGLESIGARVSMVEGGNKSNAIPREADAVVFVSKKVVKKATKIVSQWNETIKTELATVEPDLQIISEYIDVKNGIVMKKPLQALLLRAISALPHGVLKMSADIPELVETSTNIAIIKTEKRKIELITSQRSSVSSEISEALQTMASIFTLARAEVLHTEGYPGWKPNLNSAVLTVAKQSYRNLYGKDPHVKAIHAGLECGIIGEKFPGMDMISYGPTLEGVHSPDEKIHIDTVDKFWKFTLEILKTMK